MTKIDWTRIDNDANGHPRYVCHFLELNTQAEKDASIWGDNGYSLAMKYDIALSRAKKIGGKKYHNRHYGGGIVFVSYNLEETEKKIAQVLEEANK